MLNTKKIQETNSILKEKLNNSQEITFIYSTYIEISRNIVAAYQFGMPFIPFSEWTRQLDSNMFMDEHSEEIKKIILSLKTDLQKLANVFHYAMEDKNGFLLQCPEKSNGDKNNENDEKISEQILIENTKIDAFDRSLTTGELVEFLKQFPKNTKMKLESDSYYFEEEFQITAAWQDEEKNITLYGN